MRCRPAARPPRSTRARPPRDRPRSWCRPAASSLNLTLTLTLTLNLALTLNLTLSLTLTLTLTLTLNLTLTLTLNLTLTLTLALTLAPTPDQAGQLAPPHSPPSRRHPPSRAGSAPSLTPPARRAFRSLRVLSGLRLTSADEAAAVEGYRDDLLLRRTRVVRAARPP